jgi:membrane-bound metal-dependent hydrolase YbcI (DUF457 family)
VVVVAMPDVLTHVLVGYVVGTLLATRVEDLGHEAVTVTMAGALSPDFVKIKLLVPDESVAASLGIPFSWAPLHAIPGAVVVTLLAGLVVGREYRRETTALVAVGAASHLLLDSFLVKPSGYGAELFVPVTVYRFPAGMVYVSSDRWPAAVAGAAAACVWAWRRYAERDSADG